MANMTDREIQQALLAYYKANLALMPTDSYDKALEFLRLKYMDEGLCWCAFKVFAEQVSEKHWITENIGHSGWWYQPPFDWLRVSTVVTSLRVRINILETLLKAQP